MDLLYHLLTHAGIDFLKPIVQKQLNLTAAWTFALDQVLHVGIISFLVLWGAKNGTTNLPIDSLKLIFYVLLVGKPTNIVFKILFAKYQPTMEDKMDTITGAGSMIGFLERLIYRCLSCLRPICFYRSGLYGQIYRPLQ